MTTHVNVELIDILLVEDNVGDVRLTRESLKEARVQNNLEVVKDGVEAIKYLRKEDEFNDKRTPDLILLDLNLPLKNGFEVLETIKTDPATRHIPVVILTSSQANEDIVESYARYANCYVTKPVELERFIEAVKSIDDFWFQVVRLPKAER